MASTASSKKKGSADPLDIFDANYSSPTSALLKEWSDLMMLTTGPQNAAFPFTITPERMAAGIDHRVVSYLRRMKLVPIPPSGILPMQFEAFMSGFIEYCFPYSNLLFGLRNPPADWCDPGHPLLTEITTRLGTYNCRELEPNPQDDGAPNEGVGCDDGKCFINGKCEQSSARFSRAEAIAIAGYTAHCVEGPCSLPCNDRCRRLAAYDFAQEELRRSSLPDSPVPNCIHQLIAVCFPLSEGNSEPSSSPAARLSIMATASATFNNGAPLTPLTPSTSPPGGVRPLTASGRPIPPPPPRTPTAASAAAAAAASGSSTPRVLNGRLIPPPPAKTHTQTHSTGGFPMPPASVSTPQGSGPRRLGGSEIHISTTRRGPPPPPPGTTAGSSSPSASPLPSPPDTPVGAATGGIQRASMLSRDAPQSRSASNVIPAFNPMVKRGSVINFKASGVAGGPPPLPLHLLPATGGGVIIGRRASLSGPPPLPVGGLHPGPVAPSTPTTPGHGTSLGVPVSFAAGNGPMTPSSVGSPSITPRLRAETKEVRTPGGSLRPALPAPLREDIARFSMEGFAFNHFRQLQKKTSKAQSVAIDIMLQWQKEPLVKSLLESSKKHNSDAVEAFKRIQSFMGDHKSVKTMDALAKSVLTLGEILTDEIFCQLAKQTKGNPDPESTSRGWKLMALCASSLQPSKSVEEFMFKYFYDNYDSPSDAARVFAPWCLWRLSKTIKLGPSKHPLTLPELEEMATKGPGSHTVLFPGSLEYIVYLQQLEGSPYTVPAIMPIMFNLVEKAGGFSIKGIFRLAAEKHAITSLRHAIAEGKEVDAKLAPDAHTPADVIKQWFRDLLEPVIPIPMYEQCLKVNDNQAECVKLVHTLPKAHFDTLDYLLTWLVSLAKHQAVTAMSEENISIVFCSNVLRTSEQDPSVLLKNSGKEKNFFTQLLYAWRDKIAAGQSTAQIVPPSPNGSAEASP